MFVDVVRLSRLTESLSRFDYVDLVLGIPGPESGGISNTKYAKRLARLPLACTTSNTYHGDAMQIWIIEVSRRCVPGTTWGKQHVEYQLHAGEDAV
jgi:hypothetical protein